MFLNTLTLPVPKDFPTLIPLRRTMHLYFCTLFAMKTVQSWGYFHLLLQYCQFRIFLSLHQLNQYIFEYHLYSILFFVLPIVESNQTKYLWICTKHQKFRGLWSVYFPLPNPKHLPFYEQAFGYC